MTLPRDLRRIALLATLALVGGALGSCAASPNAGTLMPTLVLQDEPGGSVAMQDGLPVPTFDWQPRPRIDLDGQWRAERTAIDSDLSLAARSDPAKLVEEAGGRQEAAFDDSSWSTAAVPGTLNPPPARETGGWYRDRFAVPRSWRGAAATLKFSSVNYVADVWLNGVYLGYHEGGSTPFAFAAARALVPGATNVIAVRVDNPPWGTRNDIVPWGLGDWWNYGGITGHVWLEASSTTQISRADVVPHLDGADVNVVVWNNGTPPGTPPSASVLSTPTLLPAESGLPAASEGAAPTNELGVRLEIFPAEVTAANVADPDVRALVPVGSAALTSVDLTIAPPAARHAALAHASFLFGGPDHWSPAFPALYVLRVALALPGGGHDELWTSFGLRRVAVDPQAPRVLLNGEAVFFRGVGVHDETLEPTKAGEFTGRPGADLASLQAQLARARQVGANLIRADHTPADPLLLMLADRLGFAVWEEIPLYHETQLTLAIAMQRGIPQQMLREMALRDMNHPSVLFHGLANESYGGTDRGQALATLVQVDRSIDGTRLTGQAAYGSQPNDPTQAPLDVAGYTFYYGVFYGTDAAAGTARALDEAHAAFPRKPILALEFGRWSSDPGGQARQRSILSATYPQFEARRTSLTGGYVAAAIWWTLDDFLTARPDIGVETFGLFAPDGTARLAGAAAGAAFGHGAGRGAEQAIRSGVRAGSVAVAPTGAQRGIRLFGLLAYAGGIALLMVGGLVLLLSVRGGRASARGGR